MVSDFKNGWLFAKIERGQFMGLFSGLLGNASQKDAEKVERELADILIPEEQVDMAFSLVRDLIVFTDYRLILVDKQGVTGKKTAYKSYPYRSISRFSVETSGDYVIIVSGANNSDLSRVSEFSTI